MATHLNTGVRWIAVAAFVLGAAGSAIAQPTGAGAGAGPADAQVGFQRRPQLSPQDELAQAEPILARMDQAAATVRRQLDLARTSRDVVKSLCLSDKLSQIDVAVRSARDRQTALQAAARRNDVELANHEFTIMTVLRQRAEQLGGEATQCIGEEIAFVGATQVTTQVDPLPSEETTQIPSPGVPGFISGPPPPVSGTK